MKITLKLSEKQLGALVFSFNEIPKTPAKERIAKVAKSVLDKVALKLRKKQLEVQSESNLFNKDKKFSFSLELVEAHFLEQFIVVMGNFPMCEYDKNALLQIASRLNQQLA
jgi:formyltetrahydrofolate synthetase